MEFSEVGFKLNARNEETLRLLFSKPTPHYIITYVAIVTLIEACGGSVEAHGGSHRFIRLNKIIGCTDFEGPKKDAEDTKRKNTEGAACAVVHCSNSLR